MAVECSRCPDSWMPMFISKGILPLPIGGLMSTDPANKVIKEIDALNRIVGGMGSELPSPFMTLSFVSLPTVPELGLTDQGLINVKTHRIVPLVVGYE